MTGKKQTNLHNDPWHGWKPGSGRKYIPSDPHFDPLHPPEGYPKKLLEKEWGETFDDKAPSKKNRRH